MSNDEKPNNNFVNSPNDDFYPISTGIDPIHAISQSAPVNNFACKQGIVDVFNNAAFISPGNIIHNAPGILKNVHSFSFMPHEDDLVDPSPLDAPFIFSTSIRNSKRNPDFFTPALVPTEKDLMQSVGMLGFDDQHLVKEMEQQPEKSSNKRKGNIYTSKRNTDLFPLGMSRRQSSRDILSNTIYGMLKRRNNDKTSVSTSNEGGKHYSHQENVILVGNIYEELFKNPALKKKTWTTILHNFNAFFESSSKYKMTCARTAGALERHFKVLKEQNRSEGGKMFKKLYLEFQQLSPT